MLDADQRGVAQFVDARLDGQHRGQRHLHVLKVAALQLALHPDATVAGFNLHDDGGVRPAQQLGQQHPGLRIAKVIRLQPGKDQVEGFFFDRLGQGARGVQGVKSCEAIVFQMNGAVGSLGQRLAQHLLRPRRTGGDHHHLATIFFLLPHRLFQRIGVRLVHLIANILAEPGRALIQLQRRIFLRYLLHANQDLHAAPQWFLFISPSMGKPRSLVTKHAKQCSCDDANCGGPKSVLREARFATAVGDSSCTGDGCPESRYLQPCHPPVPCAW